LHDLQIIYGNQKYHWPMWLVKQMSKSFNKHTLMSLLHPIGLIPPHLDTIKKLL
jgi:hypothetical protein